jgi:hypothetical protein
MHRLNRVLQEDLQSVFADEKTPEERDALFDPQTIRIELLLADQTSMGLEPPGRMGPGTRTTAASC